MISLLGHRFGMRQNDIKFYKEPKTIIVVDEWLNSLSESMTKASSQESLNVNLGKLESAWKLAGTLAHLMLQWWAVLAVHGFFVKMENFVASVVDPSPFNGHTSYLHVIIFWKKNISFDPKYINLVKVSWQGYDMYFILGIWKVSDFSKIGYQLHIYSSFKFCVMQFFS